MKVGNKNRILQQDRQDESTISSSGLSNTALLASLAETIVILMESVEGQLKAPESDSCKDVLVKTFAAADLVNLLTHFEQKATDDEEGNGNPGDSRDDCFRICAAILRFAAWLPHNNLEDSMASHAATMISSYTEERLASSRHRLCAYVALLCLYGMTDDVASALASSIETAFGDDVTYASPYFESDDSRQKKTRRSSRRSRENGKVLLPAISPKIAWDIIEEMLRGSNPSSMSTREIVLSSPPACNSIEKALERGTALAERLLDTDSVRDVLRLFGASRVP